MVPQQIPKPHTQQWHSRNRSTDSQETTIAPCSPQEGSSYSMPLSRRNQLHGRLPSLDGCFQCQNDDDQVSLNSQIKVLHEKDGSDDDDDDSILSQIKLMSAVETATFEDDDDDDDTVVQENDINSDDDSLSSIVSKAYSVLSSSSCSESSDHDDSPLGYKKRVVFVRERNEIHSIPSREDFSKEEIQKAWYQHEEMSAMVVARFKEDARAKKKKEPEKPMDVDPHFPTELTSTTLPSSLLPLLQGQHHGAIKQESLCQPDEEQSEARIHALVDAVMDEQDWQWESEEEEDWEKLAKASLSRSGMCAAEALMRAQLDALAAIPIYLEDAMETLREHSTRESAHRRKLEEVYPLSPMAVSPRARSTKKKNRAARKNSVVSESRWSPASTKRTWTGKKGESSQLQSALEMPLRMASNHGESSRQQNGLSMPLRMASNHSTEHENPRQQTGLSMPMRMPSNHGSAEMDILSVVSSDDDSINSESEFGEVDFEEELAPPAATISLESRVRSKKKKKLARTRKMFTTKESGNGIYQKVKRKLQRPSKKKKTKNKRKKEKSTKTEKKKKVKGTKKGEATDKVSPAVPSGLSDEFAEMDAFDVKSTLVAL